MKMAFQNVLLWCLLATLLPCILGATLQADSNGGKKLSVWQQGRVRRDLCLLDHLEDSEEHLHHQEDTEPQKNQHSTPMSMRVRRSCKLITCLVHHLAQQVQQASKTQSAPPDKIKEYGRRRRRSAPQISGEALQKLIVLQTRRGGSS